MNSILADVAEVLRRPTFTGVGIATGYIFAFSLLYLYLRALYLVFFHPLSRVPGPKYAACSRLPYVRNQLRGDLVKWIHSLHEQYGEVVRIAPDEVSFISNVWQDIYGAHNGEKAAKGAYLKDRRWFASPYNNTWSILQADAEAHPRMRKMIAPAFSDKVLREQESMVQDYVELFILRLHEQADGESKGLVDMVKWFNFFTFDIIADMTFGESFNCLRDSDYHPWVRMLFKSVRAISLNSAIRRYPFFQAIVKRLAPKNLLEQRRQFNQFVFDKVGERLASDSSHPDLMSHIKKFKDEPKGMNRDEIDSNANILLVAGSETTATLLSGCTFMLLSNPDKLEKLTKEIRETFTHPSEVTIKAVSNMPYLHAVLSEALRIYPPSPAGFMRIVPESGDTIGGHWIPGGTSVSISQWPANHSEKNFTMPFSFMPERFLGDPRFENDNSAVLNPFSAGPRNCLGKSLANVEMRLLMVRLLLDFDLELLDPAQKWLDQKSFTLWEKQPLMVRLKENEIFEVLE
ncbi:isotrichodermin C-15 hydroxylase [Purpureocillium lavendulum]|uniref:Isotrichodermin C-15 hydroxylase n=1 Tax=Purpureocillium lavendulum TaxID=1247861 RepID=A0AB34FRP2_9HYPO|nr:isotrichodermin C-15 hydroxylase [Purpureocillium lavendulum]